MRIAFVVECFPRISETFILDQMTGFLDLGHEVIVFSMDIPDPKVPVHKDIHTYGLLERTEYIKFTPGPVRGRLNRARTFLGSFPGALVHWTNRTLGDGTPPVPWQYLFGKSIQKTYPFIRHRVDLVYCHFGTTARDLAFLKAALAKPMVTAFWGYDVELVPIEYPDAYREVFSCFDLFYTSSQYLAGKLTDLGCPPDRLRIQRVGLPVKKLQQIRLSRTPKTPKILSVGRLVPEKGYALAIEAISSLPGNVEYTIIGGGPERERLLELIQQAGVQNRVSLLGPKPREEVYRTMAESDIFLCPSTRESFGVANMEASFFGLPVLASDVGGIREIVKDGETGRLFPPGDLSALTELLKQLIHCPEMQVEMGKAGRAYVESQFDHESLIRDLERQFLSLTLQHG